MANWCFGAFSGLGFWGRDPYYVTMGIPGIQTTKRPKPTINHELQNLFKENKHRLRKTIHNNGKQKHPFDSMYHQKNGANFPASLSFREDRVRIDHSFFFGEGFFFQFRWLPKKKTSQKPSFGAFRLWFMVNLTTTLLRIHVAIGEHSRLGSGGTRVRVG